ncbi:MAG: cysteine synthase A [Methanomassiliicoccales archaeon]
MEIANHILELRYNTPMLRLRRVVPEGYADVLVKLEFLSPSSSVKDRIALFMIEEAERRGELKPGYRIVEASTGNTGVAFALAATIKGYPITIVMPEGMSQERKMVMRAYGADIVYTPGAESDVDKSLEKAKRMIEEDDRTWMPGQFQSQDNVLAHQRTTGPEIVRQAGDEIGAFVAGVGSGGTLTGVARYLRGEGMDTIITAVEPAACPTLTTGEWGSHAIEGIGDGFIPEILETELIDRVEVVTDEESMEMARRLAREEGVLCGISSGANLTAALRIAEELGEKEKVVTMAPDTGMRYFSTSLFEKE